MNTATKNREVINMEHDMIDTNTHIDTFERSGSITDLGWGKLKNHIFPCLTSPNGIFQAKKELVHRDFLDLHVHYYIRTENEEGRRLRIIWIDQTLLAEWDIDLQTLETQAIKNLIKDRYTIQSIPDILHNVLAGATVPDNPIDCALYVLTNQGAFFGATGILDKGIVAAFADKTGHDLFILPSSKHEILLCPDLGYVTAEELDEIVKEINSSAVEPCDRLSDHVYYYDREMDEIRIRK